MNNKPKVAVALSGGIDSCFCAYILSKQGYEAAGFTLKIPFFSDDGLLRARHVCKELNIPHYTIDISEEFNNRIVKYFVSSYLDGLTPNPCCLCNSMIKFGILLKEIRQQGYFYLATGHYARLVKEKESIYLAAAKGRLKPQEYFLGMVPKENLANVLFPLGDYTKEEVKAKIKESGIYPYEIRESREICFIRDSSYKDFVESRINTSVDYAGDIKYIDGRILGRHRGIYSFTCGQRQGLGISWRKPLYVVKINAAAKEVIVAEKEMAFKDKFIVKGMNWFYPQMNYGNLEVKIRYNAKPLPCSIEKTSDDCFLCTIKGSRDIPATGQLAVFYDKDRVVSGGWIAAGCLD